LHARGAFTLLAAPSLPIFASPVPVADGSSRGFVSSCTGKVRHGFVRIFVDRAAHLVNRGGDFEAQRFAGPLSLCCFMHEDILTKVLMSSTGEPPVHNFISGALLVWDCFFVKFYLAPFGQILSAFNPASALPREPALWA